jgi:DNA-binding SARP family transcriptional activator
MPTAGEASLTRSPAARAGGAGGDLGALASFRTLGPLDVHTPDGTRVFIGQRKKRRLLSLLLLHAGGWVSTEQIAVALWEDDPPRSALGNIKTYVSDLRHALPPLQPGLRRIIGREGEYRLRLRPGERDVDLFDADAVAGEDALAANRPADAARLLERALGRWRGRPYEDLPADLTVAETTRLEELRWVVWENLVDARLRLGQHDRVLPALRALTLEHPTRERLWAQLLVALDQDGRRAEALSAYQKVYRTLTENLGIEPGDRLRLEHQRILSGHQYHQPAAGP